MSFFMNALIVLCLMALYAGWRIIVPSRLRWPWNALAWGAVVLALPGAALYHMAHRSGIENGWTDALAWTSHLGLGFMCLTISLLLVRDILWLALGGVRGTRTLARKLKGSPASIPPVDPGRRRFLVNAMNAGIVAASGSLSLYGLWEAKRIPEVQEVFIPVGNLPRDLEGFRIVQTTDIHLGPTCGREWVEQVVERINTLFPHLAVFTGDLADGPVSYYGRDAAPLADIQAPFGRYFVTGNHEYYSGVGPWLEEAERLGFTPLLNEHRLLQPGQGRLLLAGATDYRAGGRVAGQDSSPRKAMAGAPASDVKILLAHQPKSVFEAAGAGFDLQISGHTHGGQFLPWHAVVGLDQPYLSGLHSHEGTMIYVSRGTGYWGPPLRLAAPSEITLFKLTKA